MALTQAQSDALGHLRVSAYDITEKIGNLLGSHTTPMDARDAETAGHINTVLTNTYYYTDAVLEGRQEPDTAATRDMQRAISGLPKLPRHYGLETDIEQAKVEAKDVCKSFGILPSLGGPLPPGS